jgi:hypothetical protein
VQRFIIEVVVHPVYIFLDSGRQHWLFRLVENKTDIYTIQVGGGRDGCNTFLSGNPCPNTASTLFGGDSCKFSYQPTTESRHASVLT